MQAHYKNGIYQYYWPTNTMRTLTFSSSLWAIKYLKYYLPKETLSHIVILSISKFVYIDWMFRIVKFRFFNITKCDSFTNLILFLKFIYMKKIYEVIFLCYDFLAFFYIFSVFVYVLLIYSSINFFHNILLYFLLIEIILRLIYFVIFLCYFHNIIWLFIYQLLDHNDFVLLLVGCPCFFHNKSF